MEFPDNLFYTKDHEWVLLDGNTATIGITDYAQERMGDIVFVELPSKGEEIAKDDTFGVVESVKSVSDCFSPLSGKVVDINEDLTENPSILNEDCYGDGWILRIELKDPNEVNNLLKSLEYQAFIKEEAS